MVTLLLMKVNPYFTPFLTKHIIDPKNDQKSIKLPTKSPNTGIKFPPAAPNKLLKDSQPVKKQTRVSSETRSSQAKAVSKPKYGDKNTKGMRQTYLS